MSPATSDPPSPTPPRRRRRGPGWWVRLSLVLAWVGLYGFHAGGLILPQLGLIEVRDVSTVFEQHLDKRYRYRLFDGSGTPIGRTNLSYEFIDGSYEATALLTIDDLRDAPGGAALHQALTTILGSQASDDRLSLETLVRLDDRFRLTGIEIDGQLLGVNGTFAGGVTHRGLVGELEVPVMDIEREVVIPDFDSAGAGGTNLLSALPPGLEPGDRFASQVVEFQPLQMSFGRTQVIYRVTERITTEGGLTLNRVVLEKDGREIALLHADREGIIHDSVHHEHGLRMELDRIYHQGQLIWPPELVRDDDPAAAAGEEDE